ncbi:LOW QUALITY PROTEIN: arylsulfatase I-like [Brachionichthys hirsutus]|uniref:LOW QUALITY PROTEIN: arylsulfatase I-like n=1 Tax=Brachionichthys hirsutus TaxID=412623 RepID=UPI003604686D
MRAPAPALLSVLLCLDSLRARGSKANQSHEEEAGGEKKKRQPPHIVFVLTDDQGFNDIGYHNPTIRTPTLDKLAAEGVTLENYYVQPICTPSRSQLITGRYQIHTGLQHSIIRPSQPSCLPPGVATLPERLRQAGYSTHLVGKWHLGFYRKACLPTRKGFDSFFGSLTGSVNYYSYESCDGPGLCGYDLHDGEGVAWGQEGKYSTNLYTQRARKILETHDPAGKPLFLLLSLQAVHTPLQTPKSYIYPYRDMANVARRKFAAMVSTVDEAVRNVTYALRKYGFYRNSVIIFSTDNGAQPFTGGSNWPLRGRKGTYWEGGIRGVAFVHSPLLRRRRRVSKALLHITDWFPTLVGLAGGNVSQSPGLDGFDVWPTISEGKDSPRHEILHNIDPLHRPAVQPEGRHASTPDASGSKRKVPASKKPKKKKPKKKSAFKMAATKKSKPKLQPEPKLKKSKLSLEAKVDPEIHRPVLKSYYSGSPAGSATPRPKVPKRFRSKRTRNRVHPKPNRPLEPRQRPGRHQNTSRLETQQPSQAVWDTSVQASIRAGDWKLLTGYPGHGDWVPLQVLPTLSGRWWNLERDISSLHAPSTLKNIWLFNITADPCERQDLADQRPEVVRQLLGRLAFYNQTAVPVYFSPDDPRADPNRHGGAWVPWAEEEEDEEEKRHGVYKKNRSKKKKTKKKKKCRLCKLQAFFLKLNTGMMSNRI